MIGKPCARKSHARFDEGDLEIALIATTPALYSTQNPQNTYRRFFSCKELVEPIAGYNTIFR
jgi:hypothetical protein